MEKGPKQTRRQRRALERELRRLLQTEPLPRGTQTRLAEKYGVSRQHVHQVIQRIKTEAAE
jgi:plasmid stabilization system protein ParE